MKSSKRGLALVTTLMIATLLTSMLVAAAFVVNTSNSAINQQGAVFKAQLAAETGVVYTKSQLTLMRSLWMSITMPSTFTARDVEKELLTICNDAVNISSVPLNVNINNPYTLCKTNTIDVEQWANFLIRRIPTSVYSLYKINTPLDFWTTRFRKDGSVITQDVQPVSGGYVKFESPLAIRIASIQKIGEMDYRIYYSVYNPNGANDIQKYSSIEATGVTPEGVKRTITVQNITPVKYNAQNAIEPILHYIQIGQSSFSRYGVFTNNQGNVYFSTTTQFSGPIHSNGYFNFIGNPYFAGQVTSAGCTSYTATTCTNKIMQMNLNGTMWKPPTRYTTTLTNGVQPTFKSNVDWAADFIPMPTGQEVCPDGTTAGCSTKISEQQYSAVEGGIFVNASISELLLSQDSTYQYISICTASLSLCSTQSQRFRYGSNQQLEMWSNNSWQRAYKLYQETSGIWSNTSIWVPASYTPSSTEKMVAIDFNGVVYTSGSINRLINPPRSNATDPNSAPAGISSFAQLTIAAYKEVRIVSDLKLANPVCTNLSVQNLSCSDEAIAANKSVLGIYSLSSDIIINNGNSLASDNAPIDVQIHATLMAKQGSITVQNYSTGTSRGTATIFGGMIQNTYGAFGLTSGTAGYKRNIVYDPRFSVNLNPPKFPIAIGDWYASDAFVASSTAKPWDGNAINTSL